MLSFVKKFIGQTNDKTAANKQISENIKEGDARNLKNDLFLLLLPYSFFIIFETLI